MTEADSDAGQPAEDDEDDDNNANANLYQEDRRVDHDGSDTDAQADWLCLPYNSIRTRG